MTGLSTVVISLVNQSKQTPIHTPQDSFEAPWNFWFPLEPGMFSTGDLIVSLTGVSLEKFQFAQTATSRKQAMVFVFYFIVFYCIFIFYFLFCCILFILLSCSHKFIQSYPQASSFAYVRFACISERAEFFSFDDFFVF